MGEGSYGNEMTSEEASKDRHLAGGELERPDPGTQRGRGVEACGHPESLEPQVRRGQRASPRRHLGAGQVEPCLQSGSRTKRPFIAQ